MKLLINYLLTVFCFVIYPLCSIASDDNKALGSCVTTPQLWSLDAPENFSTSSNALRNKDNKLIDEKKIIRLKGTILDKDCIPVPGAEVKIWQDNLGKANLKTDKTQYTASAISDNTGYISFLTAIPNFSNSIASKIHVNVSHSSIEQFETIIFFSANDDDKDIKRISNKELALLQAKRSLSRDNDLPPLYEFSIVMHGKVRNKTY